MSQNGNVNGHGDVGSFKVKAGLAQMLKGGVIMDVVTPEQAIIAEEAGACAVMALERVPADIRVDGGRCSYVRSRHDQRDYRLCLAFPSWPKPVSATLSKRKFWKQLAWITWTKAKY